MDLFEGRQHVNPTVYCAPTLIEHVSKELEKESQIQKQVVVAVGAAFSSISGGCDYSGESSPAVPLDESLLSLRLRLEAGEKLHVGQYDLKAMWMKQLLPDIPSTGGMVRPRHAVVPMGWAHALYWCQTIHERSMSSESGEIYWGSASREMVESYRDTKGIQIGGTSWVEVALIYGQYWILACRDGAWPRPQRQSMCVGEFGDGRMLTVLCGPCPDGRCWRRSWCERRRGPHHQLPRPTSVVSLDAAVVEHLNEECFEGATGGEGGRLLAALSWAFASAGKQVCNPPRARTCSAALRRLAPGESRLPVPESLLFVVANELIAQGGLQQGAAVLAAHHCYLRPGELPRATWGMIHPPVSASGPGATVTIALHPFELGASSKVGEFDETVKVDRLPLATALLRLRRIRPASERLAGVGSVALGESVAQIIREFGLEEAIGEFMMYRLRHSGPSADFLAGSSGPARTLFVPFFLEIFAGTARVSREMARLGFLAIAIDTRFGMRRQQITAVASRSDLPNGGCQGAARWLLRRNTMSKCDGPTRRRDVSRLDPECAISHGPSPARWSALNWAAFAPPGSRGGTEDGEVQAPKWTMQARRPEAARSTTPGPGAYTSGPVSTRGATKPSGPSFGFGTSTRLAPRRDPDPGPGSYGAPKDPRKDDSRAYGFGSSKRGAGYGSSTPGPGSYQPNALLTRPESPSWSSGGGRGREQLHLRNATNPGPGAYSSERAPFRQPDKSAQPAWGFGSSPRSRSRVRHRSV
ncbi:unnamed protein product [Prorocentrum cordatum]|uniref:Uncharacterized protein n=1 Tax=Prorocentrum cordatum TaxID=2364126 RepID=A0ABN9WJ32_9DINO|nr:unnamed protein product [Polarella glacialis]